MRAIVYANRLNKLNAAWSIFASLVSTLYKQLLEIVVLLLQMK